jgi:hypothetical protein
MTAALWSMSPALMFVAGYGLGALAWRLGQQ